MSRTDDWQDMGHAAARHVGATGTGGLRVARAIRKVKPRMKPEIRVLDSRPLAVFAGTIDFLASVGVALDVDPVRIIA